MNKMMSVFLEFVYYCLFFLAYIIWPVLQITKVRLGTHKSLVRCPQQKALWEMRENLQLVQIKQGSVKVMVFDAGLERWVKGGRCLREAELMM